MQRQATLSLSVKQRRGAIVPSWVSDSVVDAVDTLEQRPDDVFVVSYPKAGTTWMLQIAHLLLNGADQGVLPLDRAVGWIERDGIERLRALPSPRIIKTHLPLSLLAPSEGRWIYVARNPKDLAVSYYYHARAKVDFDFLGTWDQFFDLFLRGQVEGGDWWEHTASGIVLASERPDNVLSVWYEEMRNAPLLTIRRLASFLGLSTDGDFLQDVVRMSSLEYMQRSPLTNIRWTEERHGEAPHLRRGSLGGWRELFSPDQEAAVEEKWSAKTTTFNVTIPKSPNELDG